MRARLHRAAKHLLKRAGLLLQEDVRALRSGIEDAKLLSAKLLIAQLDPTEVRASIRSAEFKVFSQFGDDGIIQYLVRHLAIEPRSFIEFGVESYREANTRFLLLNDSWRGMVIDGSRENIEAIRADPSTYWKHDLTAVCAFVERENINRIFLEHGFRGDLGLLSIDIDGNDYWVWEAIRVVEPVLVIVEYNSVFGDRHAVTIPYEPGFQRTRAHPSNLYFGASLRALAYLGEKKGYRLIGSNSAGNNAYFLRADRLGALRPLTVEEAYVRSTFRESRDERGRLTFLTGSERFEAIREMPVYDLERDAVVKLRELGAA